jgi:N-glycosylase/DNA lyase
MANSEFKEIMEALREISIEQATIRERVETQLKISSKTSEDLDKTSEKVEKHDTFMKASLWVYGIIVSGFSVKLLS